MGAISKEAENTLFDEFQSGSENAFTKIFQQFEPAVLKHLEIRMRSSGYEHLQTDLESDVRLILWNAAKTFNRAEGWRFSTYLTRCVDNAINRKIGGHRKEREGIEKYRHETSGEYIVAVNSDGNIEIAVNDRFPCHDEFILSELMPFCKPEELAILGLICNDNDVWHRNGNLNNAAVARKLGLSREMVRRIVKNLGTKQALRSTISELTPR